MPTWIEAVSRRIGEVTGEPFHPRDHRALGGGCISAAAVLADGERRYFVKRNAASRALLFEAEADGLTALAESGAIRVPAPLCWGVAGDGSFLVMDWLDLGGSRGCGAEAGRRLAALHRYGLDGGQTPAFGWRRDNFIGATPQPNPPGGDWATFWRDQRLGYQLDLACRNGHAGTLRAAGDRLLAGLDSLLTQDPPPSLLHGDLWGGNIGCLPDGTPAIFDPAVYRGDREAELAMTELFGGFGADFYAAYREAWPLDPGYGVRKTLYNLYHVLNHLNLFGGGYLSQARSMIDRLLAEIA